MRAPEVALVLRALGWPAEMAPHGFPLPGGDYRLENGSGIAGRGDAWGIVHIRTGELVTIRTHKSAGSRTRSAAQLLRRLVVWSQWHAPSAYATATAPFWRLRELQEPAPAPEDR